MKPPNAESARLRADRLAEEAWRAWGPFVSDRQWGTVREDYSPDGAAWDYFPHDHARSRAYRWGEDALAGWCDADGRLLLGLALWNGNDPILKERLFGLSNSEGNHGEDVKELYWHVDALPSHAWQRMRYLYPQAAFPYAALVEENRRRGKADREYELLDTGLFDGGRYFDLLIDYAKPEADSVVMRITATNRGDRPAPLDIVPQLWFRNEWSWDEQARRPELRLAGDRRVTVAHDRLPALSLDAFGETEALFCDNDTNTERLFGLPMEGRYAKDGLHEYIVKGRREAVNPDRVGTKVGLRHRFVLGPGESREVLLHLGPAWVERGEQECRRILALRQAEADEYWAHEQREIADPDHRLVQRQAFAGLLWSKQVYEFDVRRWQDGDPTQPPPPAGRIEGRDRHWRHLATRHVMAMPDRWEYPWFAAWDHAFHAVAFARMDPAFAKQQLSEFLTDSFVHPNGALPAYEWAFDDANPPIQAWAAWRVYQIDRRLRGSGDLDFLVHVLNRLAMNFTWWVNRKDADGRNVFEGGFLGLDNIGVFDRSQPLPGGGRLQQADGTAWMGMYALSLTRMAIELALHWPVYQDLAIKFFEHFLQIAHAMTNIGGCGQGLWSEEHGFYFDLIRLPDGHFQPLQILSAVGLVPLFCVETLEPEMLAKLPAFARRLEWLFRERPELAGLVSHWNVPGRGDRRLLSLLRGHRMKRLLKKALDPHHFLSSYGVRSVSRALGETPYEIEIAGQRFCVAYEPGEGQTGLFGGNSNWRGPIWMPINYLLVESLQKFHYYYGDDFLIECPVGSGTMTTLLGAAHEISSRLQGLFLRGPDGRRPCTGPSELLQRDPTLRDSVSFYEYFHGETGEGLGARAQTGWTALVGKLLFPYGGSASPAPAAATASRA